MKTLAKITLTFVLLAIFGCSKDNPESTENLFAELKGTWEVKSYDFEGNTTYNAINSNETWSTSFYGAGWLLDFNIIFDESPDNYSVTGIHKIDYFFTNRDGQEYYYVWDEVRDENGTYSWDNDLSLTFNESGTFKQASIREHNETTLIFSVNITSSETNADNILINKIRNETYILERINE